MLRADGNKNDVLNGQKNISHHPILVFMEHGLILGEN